MLPKQTDKGGETFGNAERLGGQRGRTEGCRAWILAWNWAGISFHTFNEKSKLMKMQFKAKFTQFLFILS